MPMSASTSNGGAVHPTTLALYKNINAQTTKAVARSSFNEKSRQAEANGHNNVSITNELAKLSVPYEASALSSVAVPFR